MLKLKPISLRRANYFVKAHHRHLPYTRGCLFCTSVVDMNDQTKGVAIVERPSARNLQDGFTAEVTRVATDGARNACSLLYGACWRAARALGYTRLVTYTLAEEPGTSLRAAGWTRAGLTRVNTWARVNRVRQDACVGRKVRWEKTTRSRHDTEATT